MLLLLLLREREREREREGGGEFERVLFMKDLLCSSFRENALDVIKLPDSNENSAGGKST